MISVGCGSDNMRTQFNVIIFISAFSSYNTNTTGRGGGLCKTVIVQKTSFYLFGRIANIYLIGALMDSNSNLVIEKARCFDLAALATS